MIPNFDHNNVLPPHLSNPTVRADLSPYISDTLEFSKRFATSKERVDILKKYLLFRSRINQVGLIDGFQWLDGSFTQNIEKSESRPPKDLDLITFYAGLTQKMINDILKNFEEFINSRLSKSVYKLDHFGIDYGMNSNRESIIENTRYWLQLFTHTRLSVWKGMVRIELNTPLIDEEAVEFLKTLNF